MPVMTDPSVVVKLTPALLEMMKAEGEVAAGLSTEAAAAQLGFKFVKGVGYVKTYTTTATAVGSAVTAGEAIAGAGAATGAAESASVTATLVTAADGTTKIMGIGTVAAEAGAICLAGAGGYIIGNGIGEIIDYSCPDFFDELFSTVSEFITGDEYGLASLYISAEEKLSFLFDSDGHAYVQEDVVAKVANFLEKAQSSDNAEQVEYNGVTFKYGKAVLGDQYLTSNTSDGPHYYTISSTTHTSPIYAFTRTYSASNNGIKYEVCFFSENSFNFWTVDHANGGMSWFELDASYPTEVNDKKIYFAYTFMIKKAADTMSNLYPLWSSEYDFKQIMYQILYGTSTGTGTGSSKKPNVKKYDVPDKPKIKLGDKTYTRVPLPEPSDDPTKLPTTVPVLEPEEVPEPEKIPQYIYVPVPQPTPTPLPTVDPSVEPEPVPLPDIDPVKPIPRPPVPTPTPTPQPPLPVPPPISSEATGLLHVYNPTNSEINQFGSWLWTTFSGDLIDTLGKLFNNPMEAVIGLHELYCTPITGESTTIKAGFLDSGVTSRLVTKRYTEINCGALVVPEHWGNYLDYTPYTKVYCYLPFIGIVELNADDIIGHGVQVLYKIDSYNGSCIAMIITAKTVDVEVVKYQFSGNCAVEVPITSGMKSAMQSALIGAGTCAIGAAIGGAAIPVIAGMAVNNSVKSGFSNKNTVSHSGSFGSSYGAMGIKKPYIIVKRPIQKVVNGYNDKYGYPAHEMVTIGKCSGYLRCRDFDVQSSTATEDEKKLIETLLKQGVYV